LLQYTCVTPFSYGRSILEKEAAAAGCYVKETPCGGAVEFNARATDSVSVFAGELAAIRAAFECARLLKSSCGLTRFTILSYSLRAIKAVEVGRCRSRPNLFNDALEAMSKTAAETTIV
jgi:hypothetical protein